MTRSAPTCHRLDWRAALLVASAALASLVMRPAIGAAGDDPRRTYRMPTVEVEGERLTLAELIERAARKVEESNELDVPHRYTRHHRLVLVGASKDPARRKKTIVESASRIEVGPDRTRREIRLWDRVETFRGDSLVKVETDRKAVEAYDAQFEGYRNLPFAVRGGLFRYEILERRPLGDRALLRIAYEPTARFSSLPSGDAWLDTKDFVVLHQTGSITQNVPMPMFIDRIEAFRLSRRRYGPLWLEDDFYLKVRLRMTSLGLPEIVEMRLRFHDVEFADLPANVLRLMNLRDLGDLEVQAVLDSLQAEEDSRFALDVLRAPADDLSIAAALGDSLLGTWTGPSAIRVLGIRPIVRYNSAERLAAGAGVAFSGGALDPKVAIEGGYSAGRSRGFGRAGIALARRLDSPGHTGTTSPGPARSASAQSPRVRVGVGGSGARGARRARIIGIQTEVHDHVSTFGPGRLPAQGLFTVMDGYDPSDYYGSREVAVKLFAGSAADPARRAEPAYRGGFRLGPMLGSSVFLVARAAEHDLIRSRSIWTVANGQVRGDSLFPADPGRLRAVGGGIAWDYRRLFTRIESRLFTETAGHALGGDMKYTMNRGELSLRALLPGGCRLALRGLFQGSSPGLPRQEHLFLGGATTLRAYPAKILTGRSGAHLGTELHLNRDIVGWLPWIPDRGLGLEAHLSCDVGMVKGKMRDSEDFQAEKPDGRSTGHRLHDAVSSTGRGSRDEIRACLGLGCSRVIGLPGLFRIGLGIHFAVGDGDREWALRLFAE